MADLYQTHGDHVAPIFPTSELLDRLRVMIKDAKLYNKTFTEVGFDEGEAYTSYVFTYVYGCRPEAMMVYQMLAAYDKREDVNQMLTSYPCMKGCARPLPVVVDRVAEWDNHIEATVHCAFGEFDFAFMPNDYAQHKHLYRPGALLPMRLALLAMDAGHIKKEITLEGEAAATWRERNGEEAVCDGEGKPKPVRFNTERLVTWLNTDARCPDEAAFQGPTRGRCETECLGRTFVRTEICICRREWDGAVHEVWLPLYFRCDMVPDFVEGTPLCGAAWLSGRIDERAVEEMTVRGILENDF